MVAYFPKTLLLLIFCSIPQITLCLKIFKSPLLPHMQLLSEWKEKIEQERIKAIKKLEQSSDSKEQKEALILKNRNRLDHIKIVTDNKIIYLQLEQSAIFLGRRHYPYNPEVVNSIMEELYNAESQLEEDSIKIYSSKKMRKHFLFKYLWPNNDLYSAKITIK